MEEINNVIKEGIYKKINQLENMKNLSIINYREILIKNIHNYSISDFTKDFDGIRENIIYQINSDKLTISCKDIKNKFDELKTKYKKDGEKYCISKINEKNWNNKLSNYCLYIGSSNDIITRFKQHLGLNLVSRSTYSLYLIDWWPENIELQFKIFGFGRNIEQNSLQIIEDILWEEYKPLLGKKGANNK